MPFPAGGGSAVPNPTLKIIYWAIQKITMIMWTFHLPSFTTVKSTVARYPLCQARLRIHRFELLFNYIPVCFMGLLSLVWQLTLSKSLPTYNYLLYFRYLFQIGVAIIRSRQISMYLCFYFTYENHTLTSQYIQHLYTIHRSIHHTLTSQCIQNRHSIHIMSIHLFMSILSLCYVNHE